jgi:hypothetical protein
VCGHDSDCAAAVCAVARKWRVTYVTTRCTSQVARRTSHVKYFHAARRTSYVSRCTSQVARRTSNVVTSHVARHTSYVARRVATRTTNVATRTSHDIATRYTLHSNGHMLTVARHTTSPRIARRTLHVTRGIFQLALRMSHVASRMTRITTINSITSVAKATN